MWQARLTALLLCAVASRIWASLLRKQLGAHGLGGPLLVPVLHDLDAAWASAVYSALPPRVRACTVSFRHARASDALRELCAAAAADPTSSLLEVGASTICSEEQVWAAKKSGATFISTMYFSPRIVEVAAAAQIPVLGGVVNHAEARTTIDSGVDSLKFYPSSTVSPLSLTLILEQLGMDTVKDRDIIVAGGLTEDDFQKYLAAGATGFAVGIDCKSLPASKAITAKLNTLFLSLDKANIF